MLQPKIVEKNWVESYNEWARGRDQYLTFLVRVKDDSMVKRIAEIQNKLSTNPCVDPFPKEYLHITVKGCGFLAESERFEDDISRENLERIISQAKETLQTHSEFDVFLSKLNILPEVVLVEIHDKGRIGVINRELQSIQEIRKMDYDYPRFLPHISISQFKSQQEFNELVSQLERLRNTEFGELTVNSIELVSANLSRKYPTLKTIHSFKLK